MAGKILEVTPHFLLSSFQARPLLEARDQGASTARSSLNLNRSTQEVKLVAEGVLFGENLLVAWDLLAQISTEERRVFSVVENQAQPVQVFSKATGWMRTLCATAAGPPTTLISGIPMHRIKDTDPLKDTKAKMLAFGKVTGPVLDTATGLGYTAIEALRFSGSVTTIELDPAALEIAEFNPWSAELFTSPKLTQMIGDAFEEVGRFPAHTFAGVIHDPPTLSLGGELYSQEFYIRLHRVLKRGGRLFHYVGDPMSALGKRTYPGIQKRLAHAGFKKVKLEHDAYGLTASA